LRKYTEILKKNVYDTQEICKEFDKINILLIFLKHVKYFEEIRG